MLCGRPVSGESLAALVVTMALFYLKRNHPELLMVRHILIQQKMYRGHLWVSFGGPTLPTATHQSSLDLLSVLSEMF